MELVYAAVFENCEEGGYSVSFPDLPGCFTEGDDLAEAISMAQEAACGWIFGEIERGKEIPTATPRNQVGDVKDGFINMMLLDMDGYRQKRGNKSVKKTLTIPEWLNTKAMEADINFSQVLQEALKEKLGVA
ncbi:MAG: type II toxin-antitoxin system HicB family antitoxin [Lachnospiraceae bacterium]|nr:type II toxin-antitoxin system HicB family antitoxin [Lachnospiraceae bacterium]MBQ9607259.1 type II toxin-antitoxin system HicB family antitoxin [Lachnospiraceae bacterium]